MTLIDKKQLKEKFNKNVLSVKWVINTILIIFVSLNAKDVHEMNNSSITESGISNEFKYNVSISNPIISYNVSPHNLSTIGVVDQESNDQTGKCLFCHSQTSEVDNDVLWNGANPKSSFTLGHDNTVMLSKGSIKCLSCHDGATAVNNLPNGTADITTALAMTASNSFSVVDAVFDNSIYLSQDMGNNHPVGIVYDEGKKGLNAIADLKIAKLEAGTNKVTCASCHEPHSMINGSFLVVSNVGSSLCLDCHNK